MTAALDTTIDPRSLLPVAVETLLRCEGEIAFDLFLWQDQNSSPVLYCEKQRPVVPADFSNLVRNGVRTLYVTSKEISQYERHLHEHVLSDSSLPPEIHVAALREANRSVFLASWSAIEANKMATVAQDIGSSMAEVFANHPVETIHSLFNLLRHDYYTYTHVTNVCVYTLALARGLGITSEAELSQIAAGALLHDVGKRKIPTAILNKDGRLSDEELSIVRAHPTTGFYEMCRCADVNRAQLMMIYQHHERLDGGGYPVQVAGDEILPWSRICTIADVYDAITSYRPYRRPMRAPDVREYMARLAGTHFDVEMMQCWLQNVIPQPSN